MLLTKIIIKVVNVGVWILMAYVAWIVFKRVKEAFKNLKKAQSGNKTNQYSLKDQLDCLDTADTDLVESPQHKEGLDNSPEIELLPQ